MQTNLDKYKSDISRLIKDGHALSHALMAEQLSDAFDEALIATNRDPKAVRKNLPTFNVAYQPWYSEALTLIKQLLPDRLDDFVRHYQMPRSRREITFSTYRIEDALQGIVVPQYSGADVTPAAALSHVQQQVAMIEATSSRFESSLFDIKQLVQADVHDSELDAARELNRKGFSRAGGAVAGVVLEKHLGQVVANHGIAVRKKNPTISDYNDLLKKHDVLETPEWRTIQRLGDLRNLCDHDKKRVPTSDETAELIDGVDKTLKTLF